MILHRYLAKEILLTSIAVTGVLVGIFLSNYLIHYLSYVSSGKFASWMLLRLLIIQFPLMLSAMLPLGFFLGVLLAYGRLYNDSEMTVIFATGFGRRRLLRFTLVLSSLVAVFAAILMFWMTPWLSKEHDLLLLQAESSAMIDKITPGRFQKPVTGNQVYYVEKLSRDRKRMSDVFFAQELPNPPHTNLPNHVWSVLLAKSGGQQINRKTHQIYMVASNGYRYRGRPGDLHYEAVGFKTYGQAVISATDKLRSDEYNVIPTYRLLLHSVNNPPYAAELQWRISIPLAVILLGLLAVPLSHASPRQGRFKKLLPAVVIAIIYVNLLFMGKSWVENKHVPAWIGMWWIHILLLFVVGFFILRWLGVPWFKRSKT